MLTEFELKFSSRAIRRKKLYLPISIISVAIGFALAMFYSWQAAFNQGDGLTTQFVLVILILLSARQNLRQYYFVNIIEKLITEKSQPANEPSGDSIL